MIGQIILAGIVILLVGMAAGRVLRTRRRELEAHENLQAMLRRAHEDFAARTFPKDPPVSFDEGELVAWDGERIVPFKGEVEIGVTLEDEGGEA